MDQNDLADRLKRVEDRLRVLERHLDVKRDINLEIELTERLGMQEVVVSHNPDLGPAAAQVFERYVRPAEAQKMVNEGRKLGIGFSGGRTIRGMVNNIEQEYKDLDVYALSCPGLPQDTPYSVNTVIALFCIKYEGKRVFAKPMPTNPEYFADLSGAAQRQINQAMQDNLRNNIRYVFTGIGSLEKDAALSTLARQFLAAPDEPDELERRGIVGDLLYRGMNKEGKIVDIPSLDGNIVGVHPEDLLRFRNGKGASLKLVVGIAGGEEKVAAIYAACVAKYINVLVADEEAAKGLQELAKRNES